MHGGTVTGGVEAASYQSMTRAAVSPFGSGMNSGFVRLAARGGVVGAVGVGGGVALSYGATYLYIQATGGAKANEVAWGGEKIAKTYENQAAQQAQQIQILRATKTAFREWWDQTTGGRPITDAQLARAADALANGGDMSDAFFAATGNLTGQELQDLLRAIQLLKNQTCPVPGSFLDPDLIKSKMRDDRLARADYEYGDPRTWTFVEEKEGSRVPGTEGDTKVMETWQNSEGKRFSLHYFVGGIENGRRVGDIKDLKVKELEPDWRPQGSTDGPP